MPALVGRWLPDRLVLGTGVYTNGLLVGEILPVALFPLLFPALGGNWRATFVLWAVPIVAIAVLVFVAGAARADGDARRRVIALVARLARAGRLAAWSDLRRRRSALFRHATLSLPGYLSEAGRSDLISPALTALNLGQFPASLLLIAICAAHRKPGLAVRRWRA